MAYQEQPKFSWSVTRGEMLEDCELCYALHYYTSHKGWFPESSNLSQASYRQKNTLSSQHFLSRSIIDAIHHHLFKEALTKETMETRIRHSLNVAFTVSKRNKDEWFVAPNNYNVLQEMVYTNDLDKSMVTKLIQTMNTAIDSFYQSYTWKDIKTTKPILFQPDSFKKFNLKEYHDVAIYTAGDLFYIDKNNKYVAVLFTQASRPIGVEKIGSVATYLHQKYKVALEDIVVREERLMEGTHQDYEVSEKEINEMRSIIIGSIHKMEEKVVDGDLVKNVALPFASFKRSIEHLNYKESDGECTPYCTCVQADLELYPEGRKSYQTYHS